MKKVLGNEKKTNPISILVSFGRLLDFSFEEAAALRLLNDLGLTGLRLGGRTRTCSVVGGGAVVSSGQVHRRRAAYHLQDKNKYKAVEI